MIFCEVVEREREITGFRIRGHAGFADSGNDIVCSAVSVLMTNAINSCEALLGVIPDVKDQNDVLDCHLVDSENPEVQLLFRSMVFGLKGIARKYPKHVKVRMIHSKE